MGGLKSGRQGNEQQALPIPPTPPHLPPSECRPTPTCLCYRFKEMEAYILQRRDELTGRNKPRSGGSGGESKQPESAAAGSPKGFA